MGKVIRAPRATIDIWEIADRIAADKVSAAVKLLGEFDKALGRLADFPGMGPRRDDVKPGVRTFPVGNYILYYPLVKGGIELLRVIHGARHVDDDSFER